MNRIHALAAVSIAVRMPVLGLKYVAYVLTGSVAPRSDCHREHTLPTAIVALLASMSRPKDAWPRPAATRSTQNGPQRTHREWRFTNGLATSQAQSMKSRVTGLTVRFFSVTMPIGRGCAGNLIGNILSDNSLPLKCRIERGSVAT